MRKTDEKTLDYIKNNYDKHSNKKELATLLEIPYTTLLDIACNIGVTKRNINKKGSTERTCTCCNKTFPKTKEFFTSFTARRDGLVFQTKCKSCEKIYVEKRNSTPEKSFKLILNKIKNSPKRINKGFDIDLEYLMSVYNEQDGKCKITGLDLTCEKGKGFVPTSITVDRIDSSKGYVKGNIQILSYWANMSKGAMSLEEFKYFIETAYKNL